MEVTPAETARPIHHRYFAAGIATVLTLGAGWGVLLLWQVALAGRFTGVSLQGVNAHGQAQIDGWVGLFVMGFALQMFPPVWHAPLVGRRWALVPLGTMLAGIVLRSLGMTLALGGAGREVALAGSGLQVLATVAFAAMLTLTFRKSLSTLQPWVAFVLLALGCFVLQAIFDGWHTWRTMAAPNREELLWQVATFQAPLRDLQIHGLALCMILGVSLRFLPPFLGVASASDRRAWWGLGAVATGLLLEPVVFVLLRLTGEPRWAAGLYLTWALLAGGCAAVVLPWRLWRAPVRNARSHRFIRTAYLWLGISLVMLLLLPGHQLLSGLPFSHAYYGAIRHAVTVGFVSQMIVGMSSLVVPLEPPTASLRPTFVLLNLGCALRVTFQIASDWSTLAFRLIGFSGVLEFVALLLWAVALWRGLVGRRTPGPTREERDRVEATRLTPPG